MIKTESLSTIVKSSHRSIEIALSKPKFKRELNSLPKISEIFSFFLKAISTYNIVQLNDLPNLPSDLKKITEGIYKKDQFLVCASNVKPQDFKYDALYIGSLINQSCVQNEMSGIHLSILTQCSDGYHYEPIAFSYLLKDDFFNSNSTRFIVPFLNLPTTVPDELEYQWVYLAMRQLSIHFSPLIEYKFLADDDKEISLLQSWGVY